MSKLTNRVVLVTGGSRGIGAATAKRLAVPRSDADMTVLVRTTHSTDCPVEG